MLNPIHFTNSKTISNKNTAEPSHGSKAKEEYKDPLNNKWLTYVLYSTELGALIHEISPKAAQALWIPTIMYLGADIYDKYKNDENHFAPSRKRGVEQAIYQGLGGFVLPAGVTYIGQQLTSPIGKLLNKGISVNAKEATLTHIKNSLDQCVGNRFKNFENFEKFILNSLENKINARKNEKKSDRFFKKIIKYMQKKYALTGKDTAKIMDFARENIKEIYNIKENLELRKKPANISKHSFNKYILESTELKATYGKDYANDALRYALKSYQNKQIMKNKLVKTLGGITALVITMRPIYSYVKKTFIPKYIDPKLDRFNKIMLDSSKLKQHIAHKNHN